MQAREARFFADCMVGKLAKWLRILGYDTAYQRKIADQDLVLRAQFEERIILTRDGGLLSRRGVNEYLLVQSSDYLDQLREVVTAFRLAFDEDRLFRRCTECNTETEVIAKELVAAEVPSYVLQTRDAFSLCPRCRKIYWRGTHVDNTLRRLFQRVPRRLFSTAADYANEGG